jgi:broad specificity phosphatase PhoE
LLEEIPQPTIAAMGWRRAEATRSRWPVRFALVRNGRSFNSRRSRWASFPAGEEATRRAFDAHEALRAGWINAILPTDGFRGRARRWAAAIASSPGRLNAAKQSIVSATRLAFADAVALEHSLFSELSATNAVLKAASGG